MSNKESCSLDKNETVPLLLQTEVYLDDLKFYKVVLMVLLQNSSFALFMYMLTQLYTFYNKQAAIPLSLIWKMVTLANCSIFLTLPALIWDINVYNVHSYFIVSYVTLSQLITYRGNNYIFILNWVIYVTIFSFGKFWQIMECYGYLPFMSIKTNYFSWSMYVSDFMVM